MKKYFGLLFCLYALNSCDDGDMVMESFNFDGIASAGCPTTTTINTIFKISDNEALILKIDGKETIDDVELTAKTFPFRNIITEEDNPRIYKINTLNRVIYRVFNSPVSASYFCQDIPPVSPSVISESTTLANGDGRIEITTSKIASDALTPYASVAAVKYRHSVILRNITFSSDNGSTTYETFDYGIYDKASGVNFSFAPNVAVSSCTTNPGRLFRIADTNTGNIESKENLNEVLEFRITDDELAALDLGDNDLLINDTHQLIYKIYSSDVSSASNTFLCEGSDSNLIPTPVLYDTFTALNGTADDGINIATGKIIINRTPNALPAPPLPQVQTYTYTITFSNLTFKDYTGAVHFKQGNVFFGKYILNR